MLSKRHQTRICSSLYVTSKKYNSSEKYNKPVPAIFGKAVSGHRSGRNLQSLWYSADGYERGGVRRTGNRAGTNQGFKPDVLRAVLYGRNSQRAHQLAL